MHVTNGTGFPGCELQPAVRNYYYYGKLLDVVHFNLEQDYFNSKRWLLNRVVTGTGVVCGLDVRATADGKSVVVSPGLALDGWGREIIVPAESKPQRLPAGTAAAGEPQCDDTNCVHLVLCYHECPSDPAPALGDECGVERCVPTLVRERFKLEIRPGRAPEPEEECRVSDLISGDRINKLAVAVRVTQECPCPPCDPCIPLATIRLPDPGSSAGPDVDIRVRPIVYTNRLLAELIMALCGGQNRIIRGGKY